jgi:spoIIIJ-associated protein
VWEELVYDPKSEPHEFVGESREEAIARACEFFGVDEPGLALAEFGEGQVRGLTGRCVIVAEPRDREPQRADVPGPRPEERRPERRGEGPGRGERPRRSGGRGGGDRAERGAEPPRREAPVRELPSEPSVGTARGELGELGAFVLGVIERMDVGPFDIAENQEGELLVFQVTGPAAGALATGDGRCVDGLQLLANQAAMSCGNEERRVVVDVEGDAEAREEFLGRLARRVARRARDSGRPVALDPMNARDRRLIHLALRNEGGVATTSRGDGRYRQVVVAPEGTAEFEEARRREESEES